MKDISTARYGNHGRKKLYKERYENKILIFSKKDKINQIENRKRKRWTD